MFENLFQLLSVSNTVTALFPLRDRIDYERARLFLSVLRNKGTSWENVTFLSIARQVLYLKDFNIATESCPVPVLRLWKAIEIFFQIDDILETNETNEEFY